METTGESGDKSTYYRLLRNGMQEALSDEEIDQGHKELKDRFKPSTD